MTRRPRRNHTPPSKAKVALAAIKGEKTLSELAQQSDVHANQIMQWRSQLLDGAAEVFGGDTRSGVAMATEGAAAIITLYQCVSECSKT